MECEICHKKLGYLREGRVGSLHRQNKLGEIGVWRCEEHNMLPIGPITQTLMDDAKRTRGEISADKKPH